VSVAGLKAIEQTILMPISWKLSVERWKSSSVPAMPWRNCAALHSGVS